VRDRGTAEAWPTVRARAGVMVCSHQYCNSVQSSLPSSHAARRAFTGGRGPDKKKICAQDIETREKMTLMSLVCTPLTRYGGVWENGTGEGRLSIYTVIF